MKKKLFNIIPLIKDKPKRRGILCIHKILNHIRTVKYADSFCTLDKLKDLFKCINKIKINKRCPYADLYDYTFVTMLLKTVKVILTEDLFYLHAPSS